MEINLNVTAEKVVTDKKFVAAGNYKQIKLRLNLSADFDDLVVRATLNNKSVTAINGECYLPPLKTGRYILGVYGYASENGELVKRISPAPTYLVVTYGSCNDDSESPSELEEFYQKVENLIENSTFPAEFTDDEFLEQMAENGIVEPAASDNGAIFTDIDNKIFII